MDGENGFVGDGRHLLFVWSATGYSLHEREGSPPQVGSLVEDAERRYRVSKVGPSPLPGDRRPCAYLQPV
jgi:hypothetical protein